MRGLPEVVPPLVLPVGPLTAKELRHWRGVVYRRCEEPIIREFFATFIPSIKLPEEQDWFWCYIYTAIRVLTRNIASTHDIRCSEWPERDDFDASDGDLLSAVGLAHRAQIWLDRHGINAATYRGTFTRHQLTYTLPKELYAELVPVLHPRSNIASSPSVAVPTKLEKGA